MTAAPPTADALRRRGAARLAEAGVESAAHDAAELLAHVLGVEPGRLLLVDDVDAAARSGYDAALERREKREPLQHITGRAYFAGLELAVGPGVFVPRPETELIVEWALAQIGDRPARVADLCSGSGALALAIAAHAAGGPEDVDVVAVERSGEAVEYLRRNAAGTRVRVECGDVTDAPAMAATLGERDLIVANPPYVPAASPVSPEVAHDPYDAVFSGDTGMDVIEAMTPTVADALVDGGAVALEHDDDTADAVIAVLVADGRFADIVSHRDLAGRPRFVTASRRPRPDRARMEQ